MLKNETAFPFAEPHTASKIERLFLCYPQWLSRCVSWSSAPVLWPALCYYVIVWLCWWLLILWCDFILRVCPFHALSLQSFQRQNYFSPTTLLLVFKTATCSCVQHSE